MSTSHEKKAFLPTFGNKPDPLIGRETVILELEEGLRNPPGYPTRASLIIGPRGMGKTALLLELGDRAKQNGFITAQVVASGDMNNDILQLLQKNGEQYIRDSKRQVAGVSASALGFSVGLTFNKETQENYGFRVKLELLCEALEAHDKGILILVDEVQSSSSDMRELATTYQHLVGLGKNIAISMAGLPHAISSVLNDDVLTFLNRAHRVELGPLSFVHVKEYYSEVLNEKGISFTAEQVEKLSRASEGYPYLFQLIGYNLLKILGNKNSLTDDFIDSTIEISNSALVDSVFSPTLKSLSEMDIAFLKAMTADEGASSIADIEQRLDIDNSYSQRYRSRLISAGVLSSPQRGKLEFTLPYLKEYLKELDEDRPIPFP